MKKLLICLVAMAFMLNSCQQKQQAEPANPNNLFSSSSRKRDSKADSSISMVRSPLVTTQTMNLTTCVALTLLLKMIWMITA